MHWMTALIAYLAFALLGPATVAAGDTGITLPAGFSATVFADALGRARQIAVRDNGDVYVALRQQEEGKGIVALRDTSGDGVADVVERFGDVAGTGIAFHGDFLFFGADDRVVRFPMAPGELLPTGEHELVAQLPQQNTHEAKPVDFDKAGNLYVNIGAPSNACQEQPRTKESPGLMPCPQLEEHAGIWRFDATKTGQTMADGHRYASGLRNCVAMAWNQEVEALYAVPHGRDQLDTLFPEYFTAEDNAEVPAEEFHKLAEGSHAGWPYTYWDGRQGKRVLAPEYGGDGQKTPEDGDYLEPIHAFPAHWAPNDLVFYTGTQFPERFHGGAFIAWHGSWNRAPLPQAGYVVTFNAMKDGLPVGDHEIFADGFTGTDRLMSPAKAKHRPMGLAVAPDGALYITDSQEGRVWRVTYTGE
jgi:glucose/arabinose dehydrogenase